MKIYKFLGTVALVAGLLTTTSCTGDLDVTPIDPNLDVPTNVLKEAQAYEQVLAKCYSALGVSSPDGPGGGADIDGIDGGFGQYLRALYYLQELPTDESVIGWNDQTVKNLHALCWTSTDIFVTACYSRIFYTISICNEVIRQIDNSSLGESAKSQLDQYKAEARCIRALCYYHAIDLFGNVPYMTESLAIGENPQRILRADLFKWLTEEEIPSFVNQLPATPEAYRAGQGLAYTILAKLYLNAAIYTGTPMYDKCAEACTKVLNLGYTLESATLWPDLFNATNGKLQGPGHEIIFSVYQDETYAQGYGGTTFLLWAAVGGDMSYGDYGMAGSGWGGIRVTPQFADLYTAGDRRADILVKEDKGQLKEIEDIGNFQHGYAYPKFTNLTDMNLDGNLTAENTTYAFCSADFPVFRAADIYLMLAECETVGGVNVNVNGMTGSDLFNAVRTRMGASPIEGPTKRNIIDERGRELAWECHRRSDLVRFGLLTSTGEYDWAWKGGSKDGSGTINSRYNIYPIPSTDIISNTNLKQNLDY